MSFAQTSCTEFYSREHKYPSKADIDKLLYAVHLTDFKPEDGILQIATKDRARFPVTLHFSLGAPVISHSAGNWTQKKYAILLPFKYLQPQIMNIFSQDTFILGNLKLPKQAILMIPIGEDSPNGFLGKVVYYDPAKGIEESVKNQLLTENSLIIKATGPNLSDKVYFENKEIDEATFFKEYLQSNKRITHQLHIETLVGRMDAEILRFFANWYYRNRPADKNLEELEYKKLIITEQLRQLDSEIKKMNLPKEVIASYYKGVADLKGFINLIELEIYVQKTFQKSVLNRIDVIKDGILQRRFKWDSLVKYVHENMALLPEKTPQYGLRGEFILMADRDLDFLDYEGFKKIVERQMLEHPESYKFEYEALILKKAVDSTKNDRKYLFEVQKQFEKILPLTPNYGFKVLARIISKLSSEEDRQFFYNKLNKL